MHSSDTPVTQIPLSVTTNDLESCKVTDNEVVAKHRCCCSLRICLFISQTSAPTTIMLGDCVWSGNLNRGRWVQYADSSVCLMEYYQKLVTCYSVAKRTTCAITADAEAFQASSAHLWNQSSECEKLAMSIITTSNAAQ
jgi:hypothetical protein